MEKKKVLPAEDDDDNRMLFSDFLQDRNDFELQHSCENRTEVIEYLDGITNTKYLPGLVVMDQNMPKMNGSRNLQLLKNTPRYSDIPLAVYTTYTHKQLVEECYQLGALFVIVKPISPGGYHQMMDELQRLIAN